MQTGETSCVFRSIANERLAALPVVDHEPVVMVPVGIAIPESGQHVSFLVMTRSESGRLDRRSIVDQGRFVASDWAFRIDCRVRSNWTAC